MQVSTTTLQPIFEGVKQYIVPLFQRTYCWNKKEWSTLWEDIYDMYQSEKPYLHFMGSIVTIPTQTVPEGVAKFLIIDGQQRMTTFYIILTVLRDLSKKKEQIEYADEIEETLLINKFKKNKLDYYKLLPTQADRDSMTSLIRTVGDDSDSNIYSCYQFFRNKITRYNSDISRIEKLLTKKLSLVSIVLDPTDDPHIVFESLNYKGKPLSSTDLIRNYFLMKIHVDNQTQMYEEVWRPMENALTDKLPDFVRHYLMKDGEFVNQKDVYATLKERINKSGDAESNLYDLNKYAFYYDKLLNPSHEPAKKIRRGLEIINRLDMATSYAFLLNVYDDYSNERINQEDFKGVLYTLENFAVRRSICGVPTNQLNKIFPAAYAQMKSIDNEELSYVKKLQTVLQTKNYPKDADFRMFLPRAKLYGQSREKLGRIILERIEESFNHKEPIQLDPQQIQIEHVMPQTLSSEWEIHLGEDWVAIHDTYLNTLGNLTLTGYNPELSNYSFSRKKNIYSQSHLSMNKYFKDIDNWDDEAITERAEILSALLTNKIYPFFGDSTIRNVTSDEVTSKKPTELHILGQKYVCSSWTEVLNQTLIVISELEPEKMDDLIQEYPSLLNKHDSFRRGKPLSNEYWYESNLNAKSIYVYCKQIIDILGLNEEDWQVLITD